MVLVIQKGTFRMNLKLRGGIHLNNRGKTKVVSWGRRSLVLFGGHKSKEGNRKHFTAEVAFKLSLQRQN